MTNGRGKSANGLPSVHAKQLCGCTPVTSRACRRSAARASGPDADLTVSTR